MKEKCGYLVGLNWGQGFFNRLDARHLKPSGTQPGLRKTHNGKRDETLDREAWDRLSKGGTPLERE